MRPSASTPRDSGFVLIGVVMFVLALTIIGLSLFGLSSYEAQFFGRSQDQTQAFYAAQGGIQRAMFAISWSDSLGTVMGNLPPGVTHAVAMQDEGGGSYDSTGTLDWSGGPVTIRVAAQVNGETRRLEASFLPRRAESFYKRLLTSAGGITVSPAHVNYGNTCGTPVLTGSVWQGDTDSSWTACATWTESHPIYRPGVIDSPEVPAFLAASHTPMGTATYDTSEPDEHELKLRGSGNPNEVTYFRLPANDPAFSFRDRATKKLKIEVKGLCVWLLDRGARFDNMVEVKRDGGGQPCLVIVGGRGGPDEYGGMAGVWFFGGIKSEDEVPIILVSNDRVVIEHFNNFTTEGKADNLSVFAEDVFLMGPTVASGRTLQLTYDPTRMDPLINTLTRLRALPNSSSAGDFTLVSGSWQELTP